jgi:hypothetical protein
MSEIIALRSAVEQFRLTDTPVSAILKVTFRIEVPEMLDLTRLQPKLLSVFMDRLTKPVIINGTSVVVPYTYVGWNHFFTTAAHNDLVKAVALQRIVSELNSLWSRYVSYIEGVQVPQGTFVRTNFLLSRPLDYVHMD